MSEVAVPSHRKIFHFESWHPCGDDIRRCATYDYCGDAGMCCKAYVEHIQDKVTRGRPDRRPLIPLVAGEKKYVHVDDILEEAFDERTERAV